METKENIQTMLTISFVYFLLHIAIAMVTGSNYANALHAASECFIVVQVVLTVPSAIFLTAMDTHINKQIKEQ